MKFAEKNNPEMVYTNVFSCKLFLFFMHAYFFTGYSVVDIFGAICGLLGFKVKMKSLVVNIVVIDRQ